MDLPRSWRWWLIIRRWFIRCLFILCNFFFWRIFSSLCVANRRQFDCFKGSPWRRINQLENLGQTFSGKCTGALWVQQEREEDPQTGKPAFNFCLFHKWQRTSIFVVSVSVENVEPSLSPHFCHYVCIYWYIFLFYSGNVLGTHHVLWEKSRPLHTSKDSLAFPTNNYNKRTN